MITQEEIELFNQTRTKLFEAIKKELELNNGHKPYEGAMTIEIACPHYFYFLEGKITPRVKLTVYCYVLGPNRDYDYFGQSLTECLTQFNKDLDSWINEVKE